MKNVSYKKLWGTDTNPDHGEPPPISLIKDTSTGKSDEDDDKLKLRRGPTSSTLELYEFMMSLFNCGESEEFLLFIWNFNMNLAAAGTLETD